MGAHVRAASATLLLGALIMGGLLLVSGQALAVGGNPAAGKAKAEAAGCGTCHGAAGISADPTVPHLAGQNFGYLLRQLTAFRSPPTAAEQASGRAFRWNHGMNARTQALDDQDLGDLAAFFAKQPCPTVESAAAAVVHLPAHASALAARCVVCHGTAGRSQDSLVPRLAGQKQSYLALQLQLFRDTAGRHVRDADPERFHPVMAKQTARLTNDQIHVLANYFSIQSCR